MVYAIIMSGGSGTRVGGDIPKQYIEINGKPLLYYTLKAFEASEVDCISIVAGEDWMKYVVSEIVDGYHLKKVIRVCQGGEERFDSVRHGLDDLSDTAKEEDLVLIHDGARPFIRPEEINVMIREASEHGAAIAAMPVKDTIKISDDAGFVAGTTIRKNTWQIQTPQAFRFSLILDAYREAGSRVWKRPAEENAGVQNAVAEPVKPGKIFTDDSMVVEAVWPQQRIKLVPISYENIKITTPEDLKVAESRLQ